MRFGNKVAIITGASGGIGLACAEQLAGSGAKVALIARRLEPLAEATRKVQEKGFPRPYELDVTHIADIAPTVTRIRRELGEVDILICSAGINIYKTSEETTEADWDTVQAVNAKGLFFCNQEVAVQSMIPRKSGAIVNIASVAGLVGGVRRAAYCASKGAVVNLTRAEAVDWAEYNIRVNAVAPTFVETEMTAALLEDPGFRSYILSNIPLGRLVQVHDVSAAICFLVSDQASMITGMTLPVDGGWTCQ